MPPPPISFYQSLTLMGKQLIFSDIYFSLHKAYSFNLVSLYNFPLIHAHVLQRLYIPQGCQPLNVRTTHAHAHIFTHPVTFSSGCQRPVGLSRGKAKVCYYSGWYYCQSCHQDNSFLIPARLLHNWDTSKHKVGKHTHTHTHTHTHFCTAIFVGPLH